MIKNSRSPKKENLHPFFEWGIKITKAENIYLYDDKGNKYIDLTSSANVVNIGYDHPKIRKVINSQIKKLIFAPPWCRTEEAEALANKLISLFPKQLDTVLRVTTGSEAVEVAMKLARKYTKKTRFLSFEHSYHGHTLGSMSIGMNTKTKKDFLPLIASDIIIHPYIKGGNKGYAEESLKTLSVIEKKFKTNKYAAFVTETMATSAGHYTLERDFLKKLRNLCDKYNVLLIIDEVLTGFGRTGKMFSFEKFGIIPDIVCLAKGFGSGYAPIGATVTNHKIADGFNYFSTFSWNPLACAVSSVVLDIYEEEKIVENSEKLGEYAIKKLSKKLDTFKSVKDIRGRGLIIAIEFYDSNKFAKVQEFCVKKGLFLGSMDLPNILSITPPLVINQKQLDTALDIIIDAITND